MTINSQLQRAQKRGLGLPACSARQKNRALCDDLPGGAGKQLPRGRISGAVVRRTDPTERPRIPRKEVHDAPPPNVSRDPLLTSLGGGTLHLQKSRSRRTPTQWRERSKAAKIFPTVKSLTRQQPHNNKMIVWRAGGDSRHESEIYWKDQQGSPFKYCQNGGAVIKEKLVPPLNKVTGE